jgi:lysophospholipase L1-like esterase
MKDQPLHIVSSNGNSVLEMPAFPHAISGRSDFPAVGLSKRDGREILRHDPHSPTLFLHDPSRPGPGRARSATRRRARYRLARAQSAGRRQARDLPRPREEWLQHFAWNLDHSKGKKIDLLLDGDSITDFWMMRGKDVWTHHYAPLNAFDFGIAGDKTEHLLWRLQQGQVDGLDPKLIVLMIGTNNTGRDSVDQIAEGVKAIVDDYLKRCPDSHLLLLGIFPRSPKPTDSIRAKITAINQKIALLDDGKRVTYLDIGSKFLQPDGTLTAAIMPDFLHPSPEGYQIWADAIQSVVDKYCPRPAAAPVAP